MGNLRLGDANGDGSNDITRVPSDSPITFLVSVAKKRQTRNYACALIDLCPEDTELPFNEPNFSCEALAQFPNVHLSFLEHPHELETFDGGVGCFHRFKAPHRVYQAFEFAMISFDNIVQVFDLPVHGIRQTLSFRF